MVQAHGLGLLSILGLSSVHDVWMGLWNQWEGVGGPGRVSGQGEVGWQTGAHYVCNIFRVFSIFGILIIRLNFHGDSAQDSWLAFLITIKILYTVHVLLHPSCFPLSSSYLLRFSPLFHAEYAKMVLYV